MSFSDNTLILISESTLPLLIKIAEKQWILVTTVIITVISIALQISE